MNRVITILTIIIILLAPYSARADITTGLVGWWKLDDGAGTSASDSTGNLNTGSMSGFSTPATGTSGWTPSGKLNGALLFDGNDDQILAGTGATVNDLGPATWACWVKRNGTGALMYKSDDNGSAGWWVDIRSANSDVGIAIVRQAGNGRKYVNMNNLPVGIWTHLVITWDGSLVSLAEVHIYINGVEITTYTANGDGSGPHTTDAVRTLMIGKGGGGVEGNFSGALDDVRIYNRALSAADVSELFAYAPSMPTVIRNAVIRNAVIK